MSLDRPQPEHPQDQTPRQQQIPNSTPARPNNHRPHHSLPYRFPRAAIRKHQRPMANPKPAHAVRQTLRKRDAGALIGEKGVWDAS